MTDQRRVDTATRMLLMDVGDVLVRTSTGAQYRSLARLTGKDPGALERDIKASGLPEALEHGQIDAKGFVDAVRSMLPNQRLHESDILDCWSTELVAVEPTMCAAARRWARQGRLVLASNTNCLHWPRARRLLADAGITAEAYLSHELGLTKPDHRFFTTIVEADPSAFRGATFVDDRTDNVAAAVHCGLNGWLHSDPAETAAHLCALLGEPA